MAQGLSVEASLLTVIEDAAAPASSECASLEEFEAAMDELAEGLDNRRSGASASCNGSRRFHCAV